jgi:hypothetical protein
LKSVIPTAVAGYIYDESRWRHRVKRKITLLSLSLLIVTGMMLASCGTAATTTAQSVITTSAGPTALTVTNGSNVKNYSMAEIQDDNLVNGWGGEKTQDGTIIGPYQYTAVLLTDILYPVGGVTTGESVKLTSANGSSTTLTYDQVVNGNFNIYNSTGSQITTATKPTICIIFSQNGSPLDGSTGQLELGALSTLNFITDGSMWLSNVQKIDIIAVH